jgi:hypothetical protein
MKNLAMVAAILLGMLPGAVAIGFTHSSSAQTAVGGATKTKPSVIGGAAKPGPVIGGATTPPPTAGVTKPSTGGVTKQSSIGGTPTPGSTGSATTPGSTGGTAKQNPPITPPNKRGTVVTAKCAAGACVAKGTKP